MKILQNLNTIFSKNYRLSMTIIGYFLYQEIKFRWYPLPNDEESEVLELLATFIHYF